MAHIDSVTSVHPAYVYSSVCGDEATSGGGGRYWCGSNASQSLKTHFAEPLERWQGGVAAGGGRLAWQIPGGRPTASSDKRSSSAPPPCAASSDAAAAAAAAAAIDCCTAELVIHCRHDTGAFDLRVRSTRDRCSFSQPPPTSSLSCLL